MATGPAAVPASLDGRGLTTVTTTMGTGDVPTQGLMYHPDILAAGVPVYFHPLTDGTHLALFSRRWTAATVGEQGPQSYTEHVETTTPGAIVVDPVTGRRGGALDLPGSTIALTGAVGQRSLLWTSGTDAGGRAVVALYRVSPVGGVELVQEEVLTHDEISFSDGVGLDSGHLIVFGRDVDDNVYGMRKLGTRIGVQTDQAPWTYSSGTRGFVPDRDALQSMGITSAGPVSMVSRQGDFWMTTVAVDDDGARTAQLNRCWRITAADWKPVGEPVDLGDDQSYLGGGLHLQPQLNTNLDVTEVPALMYVTSVLSAADGEESIETSWGFQSVV
ncbi:hypothetical protein SEA_PUPPER_162 [Gordonia phage Pupper]|uniref:Uncharacterized protein n=1 Tax=Gordonia phage Pupper TaxID=2571249 RepID=A0A4Y6EIT7_9CAUD|nr:hypothetical protein KHQ83_gp115 [Gordonia phage Pupper]QDF18648.1 hypothetical protein SEA_PUPPER_162 [Gordonia phage Pupper]QDF18880.1 hypothetical protein SEA_SCENTAE_161 [Gordonia phage SCentae]